MLEINVREARSQLGVLLDRVEKGEEIILTRHGKRIAKVASIKKSIKRLPSLKEFRASISIKGKPLSQTVIDLRNEARY